MGEPALPKQTTPTWEIELLISGVAVFAMVQLPGVLDDAIFRLRPRFDASWGMPLSMLYIYAKTAAVILAATFVIHLLLRARWIALVGLMSVHPEGIDWSRLRLGPIAREVEETRLGSLDAAVERADNSATTVFATGVLLASLLIVVAIVVVGLLGGVSALGVSPDSNLVPGLIASVMVPFLLAQFVDRRFGDGLAADSRWRRLLRGLFLAYTRMGFGLAGSPALALMASSGGRRKVSLMITGIMLVALLAVTGSYFAMRQPGSVGSFSLFPQVEGDAASALLPAHYDDQRNPERDRPLPFIQSAVASGPYLQLMVPYLPARHEAALRKACPRLESLEDEARRTAALACLQPLYPATLDGKPLPLAFESGVDPRTGQPALVAMIDVRELPQGRHELTVMEPVDRSGDDDDGDDAPRPQRIPFWR